MLRRMNAAESVGITARPDDGTDVMTVCWALCSPGQQANGPEGVVSCQTVFWWGFSHLQRGNDILPMGHARTASPACWLLVIVLSAR